MAFHFFTEPTKLATQNADQAFGAIDINQYRLGNMFSANAGQTPKAFAVTDGQILVQKINSTDKYNIILKPANQPDLGLPKIDYIIYKGIKKDSLISNSLVATSDKNDLTRIIHENANAWYAAKKPAESVPQTEPDANRSLGLVYSADSTDPDHLKLDSASLNEAFYATNGISLPFVFAGNHIGDFDNSDEIGIVIIFEKIGFIPTFKLGRELDSKIELSNLGVTPTNIDLFNRKNRKEQALAYMDSAAFFGSFSLTELLVHNGSQFEKKSGDILFSDVIFKHFNKNKIYIDLRNDFNDSFNYYENYDNNIKWNLDNTDSLIDINYYRNHEWPILVINDDETSPEFGTDNVDKVIKLSFASPKESMLIYYKKVFKKDLAFDVPNDKIFFNPIKNEGQFLVEDLKVPKTNDRAISNYFQMKILQNALDSNSASNTTSSNLIVDKETYLDNLFPIFDMEVPFDLTAGKSALKIYYDSNFIDKNYINSSNFTVNTGIAKDSNFTTFIAFPHKYNLNIKQNIDDKIPISGMEGTEESLFLNNLDTNISKIKLAKSKFVINGADIEFLKFVPESNQSFPDTDFEIIKDTAIDNFTFDDIIILSLSNSEYSNLLDLKQNSFSNDYKVYLGIENVVSLIDDVGTPYTKFEYCLKGLKTDNGSIITTSVSPSSAIVSYTDTKLNGKPYERNYEEKIGYNNFQSGVLRYEDYFISLQSNIKTVVDDFEKKLNLIDLNSKNIFKEIRALVKKQSSTLWKTAYTYVQAHPSQPDDRPLYWARLKMGVMIKKHPYFLGDLDINSNVIPGSQLDDVMTLFEENSRNYKGINFPSSLPADTKKIIITGFDPFQLHPNYTPYGAGPETQNPSGISALNLHNKTITDSLGNKGYIQTVIFPVRYLDFDKNVVENVVSSFLDNNSVNMIMSLSLNGGAGYFDLERFAGKTRGGFQDNLNIQTGVPSFKQLPSGNEFYETTLPVDKIVTLAAANNFITAGQKLFYDQSYVAENGKLRDHPTKDSTQPNTNTNSFPFSEIITNSIEGSGGDYLSNEIFYRIARKRDDSSSTVKTGHYHLANAKTNPTVWTLATVLEWVENSLKRALDGI